MTLVQSLNSPFFPPHIGAENGRSNLHAHAQNAAISPPNRGKKYLEVLCRFSSWRDFVNNNTSNNFCIQIGKNMSINPKSVEFYQCHAKRHSICFYHNIKDNKLKEIFVDSDLKSAHAALCKWATCTRQTFLSKTFSISLNMQKQYEKIFRKRVMTSTRCRV